MNSILQKKNLNLHVFFFKKSEKGLLMFLSIKNYIPTIQKLTKVNDLVLQL